MICRHIVPEIDHPTDGLRRVYNKTAGASVIEQPGGVIGKVEVLTFCNGI